MEPTDRQPSLAEIAKREARGFSLAIGRNGANSGARHSVPSQKTGRKPPKNVAVSDPQNEHRLSVFVSCAKNGYLMVRCCHLHRHVHDDEQKARVERARRLIERGALQAGRQGHAEERRELIRLIAAEPNPHKRAALQAMLGEAHREDAEARQVAKEIRFEIARALAAAR